MNLRNLLTVSPPRDSQGWQRTWYIRQERIKKEGSEYFTWLLPATGPAAISQIEIATTLPRARKYLPLDFIEVCNNDVVNMTLIINGDETLPVPAGVIRTIRNKPYYEIAIRNDDAAVTSTLNDVIVSLRREPITVDDWARKQRG